MRRSSSEVLSLIPQPEQARAISALVPEGCHLPAMALAQARLIRSRVIAALWPEVVGDACAVKALVDACNAHAQALWWIQHNHEAKEVIKQQYHLVLSSLGLKEGSD